MEFGRNGAVLRTDEDAEREHSARPGNDVDLCVLSVTSLFGYAALVAFSRAAYPEWALTPVYLLAVCVGFVCAIFPVACAFASRAVVEHELPERLGCPPRYQHVGGGSAVAALVILAIVGLVVVRAADALGKSNEFNIPDYWGDIAITFVVALFALAIFGPRLSGTAPARMLRSFTERVDQSGSGLGRIVSMIDSWLVFIVAPMVGVTQKRTRVRYALLVGNLAPCCIAGWFLPAPTGLAPILWAMVVITAVARRWAWVEDDREVAMLTANFSSEKLRVGFDEDLSDETLWSYLSLIALLPIAMYQLNQWGGGHLFTVRPDVPESRLTDFWAWLTFYGTELAKSIPFVDWSEIYSVRAGSDIVMSQPASRHVIFAVRAITDLAFLAVLLQSLAISARTRKQIELFHAPDNPLDRLDPFVEPTELKRLVKFVDGAWQPVEDLVTAFPKYNAFRLHELRKTSDPTGPMYAAATALLREFYEYAEPVEKLAEIAGAKVIDPDKLKSAWQRVIQAGTYDLETLEYVRQALNWKSRVESTRIAVVRTIVEIIEPSPERTNVLRRILADPHVRDSLGVVQRLVIDPLFDDWNTSKDPRILKAFERAAASGSNDTKEQVQPLLSIMHAENAAEAPAETDA